MREDSNQSECLQLDVQSIYWDEELKGSIYTSMMVFHWLSVSAGGLEHLHRSLEPRHVLLLQCCTPVVGAGTCASCVPLLWSRQSMIFIFCGSLFRKGLKKKWSFFLTFAIKHLEHFWPSIFTPIFSFAILILHMGRFPQDRENSQNVTFKKKLLCWEYWHISLIFPVLGNLTHLGLRYALKKKNDIIWEFFPTWGRGSSQIPKLL